MSEPHAVASGEITRIYAGIQGHVPVAHGVHEVWWLVVRMLFAGSLVLGGCVIPPSLSVGNEDAGVNSPPAILAVRTDQQELPEPGPVIFDRGPTAGLVSATLLDTDLEDTLYVHVFVDYTVADPKPPRVTCTAPPPTPRTAQRSVSCNMTPLCQVGEVGLAEALDMTIVVFDREPLESGTPAYQAMPPGGLKTSLFYFLKCQEPTQ